MLIEIVYGIGIDTPINKDWLYTIMRNIFINDYKKRMKREIATEMAIPIGTVKTRIHEARESVKRNLKIYNKFD